MLTDIPGVRVGHWTDREAQTGCTVVMLPPSTVASGEVRGGAPATREFALLDPTKTIESIDAVVLTGGSAYGLAAADGVMRWLEANDRGYETTVGRVPIVVGLSLFDLAVGDPSVRPGSDEGEIAVASASDGPFATGIVGAGTGATVGKWRGRDEALAGGIGTASMRTDTFSVAALVAVNAVGSIDDGSTVDDPGPPAWVEEETGREHTTIGVVVTDAKLDKKSCYLVAQSAHDGLARALVPAHTTADGDGLVAAATGEVEADLAHVRLLAQHVVTRAVRSVDPSLGGS